MSARPRFTVEPWSVRETHLDLDVLAKTESLFALANGHIGMRANLDEGEPFGLPGTYLNSFYELRPLPHAEAAYGYPESGQTLVNVTNGKITGAAGTVARPALRSEGTQRAHRGKPAQPPHRDLYPERGLSNAEHRRDHQRCARRKSRCAASTAIRSSTSVVRATKRRSFPHRGQQPPRCPAAAFG